MNEEVPRCVRQRAIQLRYMYATSAGGLIYCMYYLGITKRFARCDKFLLFSALPFRLEQRRPSFRSSEISRGPWLTGTCLFSSG